MVDNVPVTATMIPVMEQLQSGNDGDDAYWWALALGACFGGNATLIAAAANVAAAGMASRAGRPIGFITFLCVGLPATVVSLVSPPHTSRCVICEPNRMGGSLVREARLLPEDATVEEAVQGILGSGVPALPVVDREGPLAGVFGEREFPAALSRAASASWRFAGFVRKGLDEAIAKRAACGNEPVARHMTTDHVDVPDDASDVQVAETFLHHRAPAAISSPAWPNAFWTGEAGLPRSASLGRLRKSAV